MMKNAISKLTVLALILLMLASGCKSKKKAMEASNAAKEKARVEQAEALRKQQEEERKRLEAEERAKQEAEERRTAETVESAPSVRLSQYFQSISSASTVTAANTSINEALTMFASPDTPVLIVISEEGGQKDYDQPTTIKAYLHYLKDQKKNINTISDLKTDSAGKIMELELRKN